MIWNFVLGIPYTLSFKPGHLSIASSASILADATTSSAASGREPPFWILALAPQVPFRAELILGI